MYPPIEKHILKEYMQPNNIRAAFDLFLRVFIEIILFSASIYFIFLESYLVGGILFYLCAIWHSFYPYLGHELSHARVFSNTEFNSFCFAWVSYLTWTNPNFFHETHRFHHKYTFNEKDEEGHSFQNWSIPAILIYLTVDILGIYRRLKYVFWNSLGKYPNQNKLDWRFQKHAIGMLIFNLMIHIILYISFQSILINVLYFLLPFTATFFHRLIAQSQHIGLKQYSNDGPLKHSRTLTLPFIFEFLYSSMNYHAEHHCYPYIPYYHLNKVNQLLKERALIENVDWKGFFFRDIWRLIGEEKQKS